MKKEVNIMFSKIRVFIFLAAVLLSMGLTISAQNNRKDAIRWKPIEANGEKVVTTNAYIDITEGARRFTGNTGCNAMSGTITMGRSSISISPAVLTRRACKLMAGSIAEDTFIQALKDSDKYSQRGSFLTLYSRRGRALLKFQAVANETTNDLAHTKWFLESISSRTRLTPAKDVFVQFDPQKGNAGGNSGCNSFGGSYTTRGNTITITEVISTMRACIEDRKMEVERQLYDGLKKANRYTVSRGKLSLYQNSKLLLTFRS
jgi:heat shock protein HslJ